MPRPDRIMEHNNNHNQHNGSGNGFLLGVIVGVLLTLLFTTKRGRAILKEVLAKGIDKFSDLEEIMRESEEDELIDDEGSDYIPSESELPEPQKKKTFIAKHVEEVTSDEEEESLEPVEEKDIETEPIEVKQEFKPEPKQETKTESKPETKAEEKTKTVGGKRWFRGLRKKS